MVPGHGHGILHHRLMGEAADLVALWDGHFRAGFFGSRADRSGGGAFAFELFACGKEVEGEKAEREGKQRAHGWEGSISNNVPTASRMSDVVWVESDGWAELAYGPRHSRLTYEKEAP